MLKNLKRLQKRQRRIFAVAQGVFDLCGDCVSVAWSGSADIFWEDILRKLRKYNLSDNELTTIVGWLSYRSQCSRMAKVEKWRRKLKDEVDAKKPNSITGLYK